MNHPTTIKEVLDNLADKVDLYRFGIEDGSIKPADAFEKKEQALETALQDITRIVEGAAPDKDYRYDRVDDFNEAVNEFKMNLRKVLE